jgi:hypothetical protein
MILTMPLIIVISLEHPIVRVLPSLSVEFPTLSGKLKLTAVI